MSYGALRYRKPMRPRRDYDDEMSEPSFEREERRDRLRKSAEKKANRLEK